MLKTVKTLECLLILSAKTFKMPKNAKRADKYLKDPRKKKQLKFNCFLFKS